MTTEQEQEQQQPAKKPQVIDILEVMQCERDNQKLRREVIQLHAKIRELLADNTIAENRIVELRAKLQGERVVKLPLRKVNSFLMLSQDSDAKSDDSVFYVMLNEKGDMERIVRNPEELS